MNPELKEWLGLTPQDFMVYAALLAVVGMYLSANTVMDLALATLALGTSGASCLWGMRPEAQLSGITNWVKRVSYPFCLIAVLACIYLNFQFWNNS